ncbi:MAG: Segregation and condensation protein [Chlamydiales bacterium]|jgi:segregation and condensation protein A|nr:Segregation and condensation protein [Chlamydiales bacterium]
MKNLDPQNSFPSTMASHLPYSLENFEGPLDFLLYLVQKQEIAAEEVAVISICEQFLSQFEPKQQKSFEDGAEFIFLTSFLLWIKSRRLLPKHEVVESEEETSADPRFSMVEQLIAYCEIKQLAKDLSSLQDTQTYGRGQSAFSPAKKPPGTEHLSVEDLAQAFQGLLEKQGKRQGTVIEEEWKVSDKLSLIRLLFQDHSELALQQVFHEEMGRLELIATFLAILELMKGGEAFLFNSPSGIKMAQPQKERERR